MNRTIGGIPLIYWLAALGAGALGFTYFKKKSTGTATTGAAAKTPAFSQQQEVQDFQIFSALTGAQQASDLNFLSQVAGLFSGGSSTATTGTTGTGGAAGAGGGSAVPSPPSTGTTAPATTPYVPLSASQAAADIGPNYPSSYTTDPIYYATAGGGYSPATPAQLPGLVGSGASLYGASGEFSNT